MYWDHHLGILMDALSDFGILEETAVVVASDHGESLGENGCRGDRKSGLRKIREIRVVERVGFDVGGVSCDLRRCAWRCGLRDARVQVETEIRIWLMLGASRPC